jgi:hypothetical protein
MLLIIMIFALLIAKDAPKYFAPIIAFIKRKFNTERAKPFDCESCSAFWITLVIASVYGNIFHAIFTAIVAYLIMKTIIESKDEITLK